MKINLNYLAQLFKWPGPEINDATPIYQNVLSIIFGALGALSVIIIIYSSIRLIVSRGNPEAIGKLRNTLIYAAIGLFVSLAAGGIIRFTLDRIG